MMSFMVSKKSSSLLFAYRPHINQLIAARKIPNTYFISKNLPTLTYGRKFTSEVMIPQMDSPIVKESWFVANFTPALDETKPKNERALLLGSMFQSTVRFFENNKNKEVMEIIENKNKEHKDEIENKNKEHKDEIKNKNKEHKDEIENKNKELLKIENKNKDELLKMVEDKNKEFLSKLEEREAKLLATVEEKSKLFVELGDVRRTKEELTGELLRAKGKLNLRGAIEYCKAHVAGKLTLTSTEISKFMGENLDKTWTTVSTKTPFSTDLAKYCTKHSLKTLDVLRAASGIYHQLSLEVHGKDMPGEISLYQKDWTLAEVVAIATLFQYCTVPYKYYDENGKITTL